MLRKVSKSQCHAIISYDHSLLFIVTVISALCSTVYDIPVSVTKAVQRIIESVNVL